MKLVRRKVRALYVALVPHRNIVRLVIDVSAWLMALALAATLRLDFALREFRLGAVIVTFILIAAIQVVVGMHERLYLGRFGFGSFEEVVALVRSVALTTVIATVIVVITHPIPTSVPIAAAFIALTTLAGCRYTWRLALERR